MPLPVINIYVRSWHPGFRFYGSPLKKNQDFQKNSLRQEKKSIQLWKRLLLTESRYMFKKVKGSNSKQKNWLKEHYRESYDNLDIKGISNMDNYKITKS